MEKQFFENKVRNSLAECLRKDSKSLEQIHTLACAVSGGADSIAMLSALKEITKNTKVRLLCVNVNHNIRPVEQTLGDSKFVEEFCRFIGVDFFYYEVEPHKIKKICDESKRSVEDVAREIRYDIFHEFIEKEHVDYLCVAHNSDDQAETLLMRFLQGSSVASGISSVNGKILRPLLNVSRAEIESYLSLANVEFRTDLTNLDTAYFRNRIRHTVVPLLNDKFPQWKKSAISYALRMKEKEDALEFYASKAEKFLNARVDMASMKVIIDKTKFHSFPVAIRRLVLFRLCDRLLDARVRLPSSTFMNPVVNEDFSGKVIACGLEIFIDTQNGDNIIIQRIQKLATEKGFFAIIEEDCIRILNGASFSFRALNGGIMVESEEKSVFIENLSYPFAARSPLCADEIMASDGSMRKVSGILESWKCGSMKNNLLIIESMFSRDSNSSQKIVALLGFHLGFRNWIVK